MGWEQILAGALAGYQEGDAVRRKREDEARDELLKIQAQQLRENDAAERSEYRRALLRLQGRRVEDAAWNVQHRALEAGVRQGSISAKQANLQRAALANEQGRNEVGPWFTEPPTKLQAIPRGSRGVDPRTGREIVSADTTPTPAQKAAIRQRGEANAIRREGQAAAIRQRDEANAIRLDGNAIRREGNAIRREGLTLRVGHGGKKKGGKQVGAAIPAASSPAPKEWERAREEYVRGEIEKRKGPKKLNTMAKLRAEQAELREQYERHHPAPAATSRGGGGGRVAPVSGLLGAEPAVYDDTALTPEWEGYAQAVLGAFPHATISSRARSDARNREAHGAPTSYHKRRAAFDVVNLSTAEKRRVIAWGRALGMQVLDEGDHVHFEPAPRGRTLTVKKKGNR